MSTSKIKVLTPQYMTSFTCKGKECEDTCCKFWRIDIDYETYKRYIKISDPKMKYLVGENVIKNKKDADKNKYAYFKLNDSGYCTFLDEEGLCSFQKKYGFEYLCRVCQTYPRRHVEIDGILERSGTVSCPEIARVMLFNDQPMEFDEFEEKVEAQISTELNVTTSDESIFKRPLLKYLWPIREVCIDILQNRSGSINDRLILLGLFANKLEILKEEEKWDALQQHIHRYSEVSKSNDVKSMLVNIPSDGYLQFKMIMEMLVLRLKFDQTSNSFNDILKEFKEGIGYFDGITIQQAFSNYCEIKTEYSNKFDDQFPQVFENYYVNYVFSKVFPVFPSENAMENYIRLAVDYAIIRMFLVGVGAYHHGYNEVIVQKLFSGLSVTIEHNSRFVDFIVESIKILQGDKLAFTTVLVQG